MSRLPEPPGWHLWRWTTRPLRLLDDGARTGDVFALRLWRPAVVGYRPDWNRAVLGDLDTFRSRGSLSGLTPYLAGGVVAADQPEHGLRRRDLNPHFHRRALTGLGGTLAGIADQHLPHGRFDALAWSGRVVRRMLNASLFGGRLPDRLLAAFLAPLHRRVPSPLVPRPRLIGRTDRALAEVLADPPAGSLAAALVGLDDLATELRIALAAGYDTTAHSLAFALWHLAGAPEWRHPAGLPRVLDEVHRMYPAGWLGSRIARRDTVAAGTTIRAGTLVLYSPYLTHRDPSLWRHPDEFRPERFDDGRPAWGYLPFAAGRRTCLGVHLARQILLAALQPFCQESLAQVRGDPALRAGLTLRPHGPLILARGPAAGAASGAGQVPRDVARSGR